MSRNRTSEHAFRTTERLPQRVEQPECHVENSNGTLAHPERAPGHPPHPFASRNWTIDLPLMEPETKLRASEPPSCPVEGQSRSLEIIDRRESDFGCPVSGFERTRREFGVARSAFVWRCGTSIRENYGPDRRAGSSELPSRRSSAQSDMSNDAADQSPGELS